MLQFITPAGLEAIGVEPEGADAMASAIEAGGPVSIDLRPSIADGLMPVRVGDLTYAHVAELVDDVVLVTDDEILEATRRLMKESRLVVEFSGAATVAALIAGRAGGSRVVAILSGGNLDAGRALDLLAARSAAGVAA